MKGDYPALLESLVRYLAGKRLTCEEGVSVAGGLMSGMLIALFADGGYTHAEAGSFMDTVFDVIRADVEKAMEGYAECPKNASC